MAEIHPYGKPRHLGLAAVLVIGCANHEASPPQGRSSGRNETSVDCYAMVELPSEQPSGNKYVNAKIVAIDAQGRVLVWFWTNECDDSWCPKTVRAYVWKDGHVTNLQQPSGIDDAEPIAMNDAGVVVGTGSLGPLSGDGTAAFVWRDGVPTALEGLGGIFVEARAINAAGTIVGSATTANGKRHATMWRDGSIVDLSVNGIESRADDINDAGAIVGLDMPQGFEEPTTNRAFVWTSGSRRTVSFGDGFLIRGAEDTRQWSPEISRLEINALGDVAGTKIRVEGYDVGFPVGPNTAFVWHDGTTRELPTLGGTSSRMSAFNDRGDVVGESDTTTASPTAPRAFFWSGGVMQALDSSSEFSAANDVNAHGRVVGEVNSEIIQRRPFVWEAGVLRTLPAGELGVGSARRINGDGLIGGVLDVPTANRPVVWVPNACATDAGVEPTPDAGPPATPDTGPAIDSSLPPPEGEEDP